MSAFMEVVSIAVVLCPVMVISIMIYRRMYNSARFIYHPILTVISSSILQSAVRVSRSKACRYALIHRK